MRPVRFPCLPFLLSIVILLAITCSKSRHEKPAGSIRTILSIDDTCTLQDANGKVSAFLCPVLGSNDTLSLGRFNRMLDSMASAISEKIGDKKNGTGILDSILGAVYALWNIGFDPCDTVIETLLPQFVFKNRKGACLGVSLVILMLAERLNCPVFGVVLPGHFFCRYDDGAHRINIEPNLKGCAHPDDYYRQRYPCEHRPGYGLGNLDKKAIIGVLCFNAGTLCLEKKKYDAAVACYREAVRRVPAFAEAKGNCAVAYAKKGDLDTALVLFEELFTAHPDMVNLAVNYGYVATAARQFSRAISIYRKGLEYFPGDSILRKRLDKMTSGFKLIGVNKKKE
jgi:regulator of sirC expression with transglutaminase-like and TPR domain